MIFSVLAFVFGVLLVQQLAELPAIEWLILIVLLILASALVRCWRVSFFLFGIVWAFIVADHYLSERLTENLAGKDLLIEGKITGLPKEDEKKVRFNFLIDQPQKGLPEKIRLSWYYPDQNIQAGQVWRFTVRLKPPQSHFNPGGFDYERWLYIQNIGATGYIRNQPVPVLISQSPVWQSISQWRQIIANHVTNFSGDSSFSGLIKALIIGDRSTISYAQWQVLRKTGTLHLVAISGLHIGLVSGIIYVLLLSFWPRTGIMRWLPAKIAALASIMIAIFYAALAGFSIPTQRAMLMLCVFMGSIVLSQNSRPFNTLSLAMLIVVMVNPLAVLSEGFWLSFMAVGIIIYTVGGRLKKPGYWQGALKIHFVIALALSPLLILFFQQTSLIAPLANLVAVPIVGFIIVPLALISAVLLFIAPGMAQILFRAIDYLFLGLWSVLKILADSPLPLWNAPQPSLTAAILSMIGILLLLAPKGMPCRWLSFCLFLPLIFPARQILQSGEVKMTLLDVGQGLSSVVQTANHSLVFDTGAKYSARFDSGSSTVIPYLRYENINEIDRLIISHGDNDHSGGAGSLIQGIVVKRIVTSVPERFAEYASQTCKAGQSWQWDDVDFLILSPKSTPFGSDNDNSCVLLIRAVHGKFLFTGDIESDAENWLVNYYGNKLKADVLIAPHHGSKTSSSKTFLKQVQARYVLIPAGYRNRFGFPHEQVMQRYKRLGMQAINTADSGAITVMLGEQGLAIDTWRNRYGKYWNK